MEAQKGWPPKMVMWVFGYGSLLWRPGFEYDHKLVGFIKGYRRVFHQGNTDHRGTPEFPGRTVTLEEEEGAICWGVALMVSGHVKEQLALTYLELREKEYDVRTHVDFYTVTSQDKPAVCGVLVYIASADKGKNPHYLGSAPLPEMAWQIAKAVGPSGPNAEYVFRLQEVLCELGVDDEDVKKLANEVRRLLRIEMFD